MQHASEMRQRHLYKTQAPPQIAAWADYGRRLPPLGQGTCCQQLRRPTHIGSGTPTNTRAQRGLRMRSEPHYDGLEELMWWRILPE